MEAKMSEALKYIGDVVSVTALLSYFAGALPVIATALTVIWTAIRIYETDTVQRWLGKKKNEPSVGEH
jgi:hypothetical protein